MAFGFYQQIQHKDVIMTSNYVILSIMSFLEVENDKYIIMCNFGGRYMSGFDVIVGPSKPRLNNSN